MKIKVLIHSAEEGGYWAEVPQDEPNTRIMEIAIGNSYQGNNFVQ